MANVALDRQWVRTGLTLVIFLITLNATSRAQAPAPLTGTVVDEAGSAVPGARVTANDVRGAIRQTTTTDGAGTFALRGLAPGTYVVLVEMPLFTPSSETVTIPTDGPSSTLRTVLKTAGLAETVVVTARRAEARLAETPQKIEVIDSVDLERSVAADLTDVLKKNAGVEVVQLLGLVSWSA